MVKLNIYQSISHKNVASQLIDGKLAIIPTDTQYGVVCRVKDPNAAYRLYKLKKRHTKPGTIIASSLDQLVNLGIKARYLKAVDTFWPNPISIVIPVGAELKYLHQGLQTLAVRIPKDRKLCELLNKTGPLLTSSANNPKETPVSDIKQATKVFGKKIDFYVDGGNKSGQLPSTVIRIVDDAIEILRKGAMEISESGSIE